MRSRIDLHVQWVERRRRTVAQDVAKPLYVRSDLACLRRLATLALAPRGGYRMDERAAATMREKIAPSTGSSNGPSNPTSLCWRLPQQADAAQISMLTM